MTTTNEQAVKTCGVFKVVSSANEEFGYIGASSQIEIVFRDYMNWATQDKAPKAIQKQFDDQGRDASLFSWELLEETTNDKATLKARKKFWKTGEVVEIEEEPEPEPEPEELTIEERNRRILERLEEGVSVSKVAEEFGVSKSTVYNVKNA